MVSDFIYTSMLDHSLRPVIVVKDDYSAYNVEVLKYSFKSNISLRNRTDVFKFTFL